MAASSPLSIIPDMCFTALNDMPRLVACDMNVSVELKSDVSPMPVGPSSRATNLLRTACAFGIDQVYCSMMCADIYNPKTIQASQGAIFHIPVCYTDLKSLIHKKQAEGLTIYGTSLHERSLPI